MKKNNSNSGLYGRVTKKQMGGAAKPVGMSGPGFLAGEIPPAGKIIRPGGGGSGIDDESPRGKKRPSGRGGNVRGTVKTGPGRGPRGPSRDQLQRIQEMLAGKADRGGRGTRMPRLPGGGGLTPPEMGPNPDAERMGPRRFEGMGASIIEALGIKSDKMGDKSRKEPPRPRATGGRRGRGRRK